MGLNPNGRDWGLLVNWDSLGKAYAGIIIAWTIFLLVGIVWLVLHRREPYIRMRNIWIIIASCVFLWVYLFKIFMAYTTNGHFTCRAEYWIMSIYLPFGIALFQANVMQLRSIAKQQARLLSSRHGSVDSEEKLVEKTGFMTKKRVRLTEAQKGYLAIGVFMLVQIIVTSAIYATSPVLQGNWSSLGRHIPFNKGQALCRRSVQWVPSAFWQLFWSWIYGPYLLFTLRHVHDTHYWRLQTLFTVVAGLPGTPLWLAAVFSTKYFSAFKGINKWWVPPMWLAPGIMVMQFVTIYFPIFEGMQQRAALRRTPYLSDRTPSSPSSSESPSLLKKPSSDTAFTTTRHSSASALFEAFASSGYPSDGTNIKDLYRLAALEKALALNPRPLLIFAALKDFTAENIIFLLSVREWKRKWRSASRVHLQPEKHHEGEITKETKLALFLMAVEIYFTSISEATAEVPLNIDYAMRRRLDNIFSPYKYLFTNSISDSSISRTAFPAWDARNKSPDLETASGGVASPFSETFSLSSPEKGNDPQGRARTVVKGLEQLGALPEVREDVFDEVVASVETLVLTNTWRRFVDAGLRKGGTA